MSKIKYLMVLTVMCFLSLVTYAAGDAAAGKANL
jgi:hypothetical protein